MKITIIGAGISGLATAIALRKKGHQTHVYEASSSLKSIGGALGLHANAKYVFEQLQIFEHIEPHIIPITKGFITDENFNVLRKFPKITFGFVIKRFRLLEVLFKSCPVGSVFFDKQLVDFKYLQRGGIELHFSDSTITHTDVLIGADGIHSTIRKKIAPETKERFSKQSYYAGFSNWQLPADRKNDFIEMWGKGLKFGIVPLGNDGVYWFACKTSSENESNKPFQYKQTIETLFQQFHPNVKQILEQSPQESIFHSKMYDLQPSTGMWHDEQQIGLVGDAAHATTPNLAQGACQALEDALILSLLFGQCQKTEDIPSIFNQFQQIRITKVKQVVDMSWSSGKMSLLKHPIKIALRNTLLRLLPHRLTDPKIAEIMDMRYAEKLKERVGLT